MTVLKFIIVVVLIAWTTIFVQTKPTFTDDYYDYDDYAYKTFVIDFGSCYCGIDVSDILEVRSRPMADFRTELFIQCNPAGEEKCLNRCKNETSKLIDVLCKKKGHYTWTKESYIYNNFCAASFWSKIGKTTNTNICCHNNNAVNCTDMERVKRTAEFYSDKPVDGVIFEENFIREEDGSIFIHKDLHSQSIVQHNKNNMKEIIEQEDLESTPMPVKRALLSKTEVTDQMNDHYFTNTDTASEFLSHIKESGNKRSNFEESNDEIFPQRFTDANFLAKLESQYIHDQTAPNQENFSEPSEMELIKYYRDQSKIYGSEITPKTEDDLETTETTTVTMNEIETTYRTLPYTIPVTIPNNQSFTNHQAITNYIPNRFDLINFPYQETKSNLDIPDISATTSNPYNEEIDKDDFLNKTTENNILMKNDVQVTEVTETVTTDQYSSELFSLTTTNTTETTVLSNIISAAEDETLESTLSSLSTTTFESTTLSDDEDSLLHSLPKFKLNPLYFNASEEKLSIHSNIGTAQ
ncbi:uncharacterized protein LOC142326922 [Lycorma delicatula]|uniref:uncharacterized protein LOC142326922 n=1 Tax=Lycorma delicatula TaxID=130591 RepID=UPI003F519F49